jgi:RNA polymerase sigma-70 factor (ECF subfamily)
MWMLLMSMIGTGPRRVPAADSDDEWHRWIEGSARGEQQSLARLYDQSNRLVYGIALRILGDPADAEEVTLDVYTQVWRTARDYTPDRGAPSSWLIMLARSRALDRLRSRGRRTGRETTLDTAGEPESGGHLPDEAAFLSQASMRVRSAMAGLAPEQREAIELSFFSGLTHSELAARLGQPLGTVKTRIRSGMTRLREAMGVGGEVN